MAEVGKAAKLAAARQKLKDHQQKKYIQAIDPSVIHLMDNSPMRKYVNEPKLDATNSDTSITTISTEIPVNTSTERSINDSYNLPINEAITPHDSVQHQEFQQQMQHHMLATEILVKDKTDLETKVLDLEASLLHVDNKHQETSSSLDRAKQMIIKLESDLKDSKDIISHLRRDLDSRTAEIENRKLKEGNLVENKTDLEEQLESTKTLLVARQTENNALQSQLAQVRKMLDISQLHLQQLRDGQHVPENNTDSIPEPLMVQIKLLQNSNSRLEQQVNSAQMEREQLVLHYQQHIERLYEQQESTAARCRQLQQDNDRLTEREASLVDQMSVVEKRMQGLLSLKEELMKRVQHVGNAPYVDTSELDELRLQLVASKEQVQLLHDDYNCVKRQLSDAELKINELSETIQNIESDRPDATKLNAANESDKVAAQRATVQNAKLKEYLQNLQDAFIAMSNDKLELTEKLQAEKFLNRELTIKLSETEETLKEIQSTLMAKDEEMIRLQGSCSQLEKEILQRTQEIDRLRHYEATQSNDVLMTELEFAQRTVTKLNHEISTLRINNSHTSTLRNNESETLSSECANGAVVREDARSTNQNVDIVTDTNLNVIIPTEEAMIKLQQRFFKTMEDVAELSDEKQKLEHLVLQLQGETETICEYIALYQKQRGILNQREEERAAQMKYLAAEREHMKAQLEQLRCMVTAETSTDQFKQEKVEEIVNLLSEIKQSHLIEPDKQCSGLENFHPCPWCSGQLINV